MTKTKPDMTMITLYIPDALRDAFDNLSRAGIIANRSEGIRQAMMLFIQQHVPALCQIAGTDDPNAANANANDEITMVDTDTDTDTTETATPA